MGWLAGLAVYFLIWWVVLFAVLPFGVRLPDQPEPGHAPSAPINPRIGAKLIATTILAAIVWAGVWFALQDGWISFRPD